MSRLALLLVAVVVGGCGPKEDGLYRGTLDQSLLCPPRTEATRADSDQEWHIRRDGNTLSILPLNYYCGTLVATYSQPDEATLQEKTCPASPVIFGASVAYKFNAGRILFDHDRVTPTLNISTITTPTNPDAGTTTCNGVLAGSLARVEDE